MTHITCRLTAKNRDQLRNLALGNRVRATFLQQHANEAFVHIRDSRYFFPFTASTTISFKRANPDSVQGPRLCLGDNNGQPTASK